MTDREPLHRGAEPRGRSADRPSEIPRAGWRDIAWRVKSELAEDNVSLMAAGVAFYALLAIFPALAAAVAIYGWVADPQTIERQVAALSGLLPPAAVDILEQQMRSLVQQSEAALSIGAIGGLLLALWSASKGITALMTALDIVYDEPEKRGYLRYYGTALALTLGGIIAGLLALAGVVGVPAIVAGLNLGIVGTAVAWLRWPLLAVLLMLGLAVIYAYGPSREPPKIRWVSWGAAVAAVLWLIGSALFSLYVSSFGNYNETYGSIGAVVVLLLWLSVSAYIVLLGAEINAEMEHQTGRDTTTGPSEPMGRRGARMADTIGPRP